MGNQSNALRDSPVGEHRAQENNSLKAYVDAAAIILGGRTVGAGKPAQ